ncbi:MBL fold metallo-hydrolase [Psychroserpens sp. XS_ASV72]|uniref:MBL fold metallo-hydrolase n=1 Tax=Psychroserpens sp. XS_ASV72 TaxID=3241293 RepID=UPI0035161038
MKFLKTLSLALCLLIMACKTDKKSETESESDVEKEIMEVEMDSEDEAKEVESQVAIHPISHGTLALEYKDVVFYVDPVGGAEAFEGQKPPTLILVTDIHGDHLNVETLQAVKTANSKIIAPQAVVDQLPDDLKAQASILSNFESKNYTIGDAKLTIEAIPMYNLREEALKFHPKNRGNGYVLTLGEERVYISGDTEDIPEMRNLKDIDIAFVCMNLPYTMTVESAADAVLDFKPKKVYPYHYRGTEGLSDVDSFKSMVNEADNSIEVALVDWYDNSDEL